jgi:predicted subunit of tRNA(5-methylaminomethyl-2-thiouridylate) methyltransferase
MSNINELLQVFCRNHAVRIIDDRKEAYKFNRTNVAYYSPDSISYDTLERDIETLYTIEISESELEKIANFENDVLLSLKSGEYDFFRYLKDKQDHEIYMRRKYAAVEKAYEQYALMLKLAESGEI